VVTRQLHSFSHPDGLQPKGISYYIEQVLKVYSLHILALAFRIAVAVGMPVARHPSHKTVRALLRMRLLPRRTGEESLRGIKDAHFGRIVANSETIGNLRP
ncbi:MAG TPA: hypothetical protein VHF01_02065, partial [Candidatus Acidoferrum sp.]|nr:hypothetical protein [Candidatus Acidoferrum sp.]